MAATKAGHTGTLDPMAQGLLPVCLGQATRFSSALLQADKTYTATMKLGYVSNTGDAEGVIEQLIDPDVISAKLDIQQVADVVHTFLGQSSQIPPMYSALKKMARRCIVMRVKVLLSSVSLAKFLFMISLLMLGAKGR